MASPSKPAAPEPAPRKPFDPRMPIPIGAVKSIILLMKLAGGDAQRAALTARSWAAQGDEDRWRLCADLIEEATT